MGDDIEGEAILDLKDLKPEEREMFCKKLGGLFDKESQQCLVKIKIDKSEPTKIKILKFDYG